MFIISSERMFTLFIAEHITLSNLVRIVFKSSQVLTPVQGSGVLKYVYYSTKVVVVVVVGQGCAVVHSLQSAKVVAFPNATVGDNRDVLTTV